jgi:hypothetical protein
MSNPKVTVKIIGLSRQHVSPAYFRLPSTIVGELIQEDEQSITVQYGAAAYCFKQSEVCYMIHDELPDL